MDLFLTSSLVAAGVAGAGCAYFFVKNIQLKGEFAKLNEQLKTSESELDIIKEKAGEVERMRLEHAKLIEAKSTAEAFKIEAEKKIAEKREEVDSIRAQMTQAMEGKNEAEKLVEQMRVKVEEQAKRISDWEETRKQTMDQAKAAMMETTNQISSKLLEDHKRELAEAQKTSQEFTTKTTSGLLQQMEKITESVSKINEKAEASQSKTDKIWASITSPTATGALSEMSLENSLKNLGLEPMRDFIMQYHVQKSNFEPSLRPDAVIFLPQDMVMVIDSKTSKYIFDINNEDETERDKAIYNLKRTMRNHLKTLISKDYRGAVDEYFQRSGQGGKISTIMNVMFVPTEIAIETIKKADPDFMLDAEKHGIIIAGPASLSGLFSLAKLNIEYASQAENQREIIESMKSLIDGMITTIGYAEKSGRAVKISADHFASFANSVNKRILPKMRKLFKLGVGPSQTKQIPNNMFTLDIRQTDELIMIDTTAEAQQAGDYIEAQETAAKTGAPKKRGRPRKVRV